MSFERWQQENEVKRKPSSGFEAWQAENGTTSVQSTTSDPATMTDEELPENIRDQGSRVRNAYYYTRNLGLSVDDAYDYEPQINELLYGEGTTSQAAWSQMQKDVLKVRRKGLWTAFKHGRTSDIQRMTQSVAGLGRILAEHKGVQASLGLDPVFRWMFGLPKDVNLNEFLVDLSNAAQDDIRQYHEDHPEMGYAISPDAGYAEALWQTISRPENLVQGLTESASLMLEGMLGGAPAMALPIIGAVYQEARSEGTDVVPALAQSMLTGIGEAAIENWTLQKKIGLAKNVKRLLQGTPGRRILWEGTKAFFRGTAEEGSQTLNQNIWQWFFTDRSQQWFEGVEQSMAMGGPLEAAMSGAFAGGGAVGTMVQHGQAKKRLSILRKAVERATDLTDQQKQEILPEIDKTEAMLPVILGMKGESEGISQIAERATEGLPIAEEAAGQGVPDATQAQATEEAAAAGAVPGEGQADVAPTVAESAPVAGEAPAPEYKKMRKSELGRITRAIKSHPIYKAEVEAAEAMAETPTGLGTVYVPKEYQGDIEAYAGEKGKTGANKAVWDRITFDKNEGQHWDDAAQELGWPDTFDGFMERFILSVEGGVAPDIAEVASNKGDPELDTLVIKRDMLLANEPVSRINAEIEANLIEGTQGGTYQMSVEDARKLANQLKIAEQGPQYETSVGAAAANWQSRRRAIDKAQKLSSKEGRPYYVIQQQGGRFMVKNKPPKKGHFTLVDMSRPQDDQVTFFKQASPTIDEAFDYGEKGKATVRHLTALEKYKLKAQDKAQDLKALRKEIYDYIMRNVDASLQGKFFPLYRAASERTTVPVVQKDLMRAIAETEKMLRATSNRKARKALSNIIAAIKSKYGTKGHPAGMMRPDLAAIVEPLIQSFELANRSPETVSMGQELKEMAQQVLDTAGDDAPIRTAAQHILDKLRGKAAKTVGLKKLDAESLNSITEVLQWAMHEQKWGDRSVASRNNQKYSTIRETIADQLQTASEKTGVSRLLQRFFDSHANLEVTAEAMSGGQNVYGFQAWRDRANGLVQFVYDAIDNGVNKQLLAERKIRETLRNILVREGVTEKELAAWVDTVIELRIGSGTVSVTGAEIMSMYMHARHPHNLEVLLQQGMEDHSTLRITQFKPGTKQRQTHRKFIPTMDELATILNTLSPKQVAVCEAVGAEVLDTISRDLINQTSLKLLGYPLATIDNYWSGLRYHDTQSKGRTIQIQTMLENLGMLKERTGTGKPLRIRGFFVTLERMTRDVSSYHGMAPALRDARTIVNDNDLIQIAKQKGQLNHLSRMQKLLDRIEGQYLEREPVEQVVQRIMTQGAKAIFSLNPKIAPRQVLSYQLTQPFVDKGAFLAGMTTVGDQKSVLAEIKDLSPQLYDRIINMRFDRDIGSAADLSDVERFFFGHESLRDKGLIPMRFFDTQAIFAVWRAARYEIKQARPDLDPSSAEYKDLLRRRAEFLVRRTQPTWHPKDRTLVTTSPSLAVRPLTMFYSQREKIVMIQMAAYSAWKAGKIDNTTYASVTGSVFANAALIALYGVGFAYAMGVRWEEPEEAIKEYFQELLGGIASLPYGGMLAADIIRVLANRMKGKGYPKFQINTLPMQAVEKAGNGAVSITMGIYRMITDPELEYASGPRKGMPKWKGDFIDGAEDLAEIGMMATGLPYVTINYAEKALRNYGVINDD